MSFSDGPADVREFDVNPKASTSGSSSSSLKDASDSDPQPSAEERRLQQKIMQQQGRESLRGAAEQDHVQFGA